MLKLRHIHSEFPAALHGAVVIGAPVFNAVKFKIRLHFEARSLRQVSVTYLNLVRWYNNIHISSLILHIRNMKSYFYIPIEC